MLLRFLVFMSALLQTSAFAASLKLSSYTGFECGETPVIQESSACGVESFQLIADAHCNPLYESAQDGRCGPASYIAATTDRCGEASYNIRTDKSCPGYISYSQYWTTDSSCPSGFRETGFEPGGSSCDECNKPGSHPVKAKRQCTRNEFTPSCRKPEFGVEAWNTCEHPDHGVAAWNSCSIHVGYEACRSPNHPVEKYNTCQVGKTPNTCQVSLAPSQIEGWMSRVKADTPTNVKNFMNWVAHVQHLQKDAKNLGCLIKRISTEPGFAGDVIFEEEVLSKLMAYYQSAAGKGFALADFTDATCLSPLASVKEVLCLDEDTSSLCSAVRGYRHARSVLTNLQEDLSLLKGDDIVSSRTSYMPSIENIQKTLSDTLSREQESAP